ncbi:MAG: membrane protein insertion efficiency factor YidD [Planctomycetota bacterium]|nr:MAG: membrane protein insertion efficiency factor YidD [Planctomycetota bacterium]
MKQLDRAGTWALVFLVRAYQVMLRPLLIGSCKFCPTCSEYAVEALCRHGAIRGMRLALGRLLRCHPFGPGGIDPVPPAEDRPVVS